MSDIDEIKLRLNISDIIGKHVRLKKAGRNFKGLCPFHSEKSPSFVVSPERQIFHCFGCGKGGTVFDFMMEFHHIDFPEALDDLAVLAGVTLTRRSSDPSRTDVKEKLYAVNHLASEFYHYLLLKHSLGEAALLYLKNRGISEKSIKTFMLGYSPNSWDGLYKYLRKKGYEEEILEKAGLIIRMDRPRAGGRGYYDRFRGRVMFTLKDHRGNVIGFAGRITDSGVKDPSAQAGAKYINTSETPVYIKSNVLYGLDVTRNAIQKANEAVVMEGELDVISSFQAGISNVVAIKGSAVTEAHVRLLKRYTERLTFALDSDMAGDAASRRGIEIAEAAGLELKVASIPTGKDPDEAARENPGLLKKAIADAKPVYDYIIESASARNDVTTAYGKKKISDEIIPVISKIDNPIVRSHYVNKVSQLLGTSETSLEEGIRRFSQGNRGRSYSPQRDEIPQQASASREDKLETYLLALLIQGNTVELFDDVREANIISSIAHPAVKRILAVLSELLIKPAGEPAGTAVFLVKDFADSLPDELHPVFDEAYLWDIEELLDSEDAFNKEWHRVLKDFRKVVLHRRIQDLTKRGSAEGLSDEDARKIQTELRETSLALKDLEK